MWVRSAATVSTSVSRTFDSIATASAKTNVVAAAVTKSAAWPEEIRDHYFRVQQLSSASSKNAGD